jgi:hypothetical protein
VTFDELKPNKVLRGPIFPEPVEVIVTVPMGDAVKLFGRGVQTGKVVDIILTPEKLALLQTTPDTEPVATGDKRTVACQLGEQLSQMTNHYLLMTATPHKGKHRWTERIPNPLPARRSATARCGLEPALQRRD